MVYRLRGKARGERLPMNVFFLGLVSMFTDFSTEVTVRTLPLFLSNVLGVKASIIGLIEGVADSTATLASGKRRAAGKATRGGNNLRKDTGKMASAFWP